MKQIKRNTYKDWFNEVCPGCVEGYPGCSLSQAIDQKTITVKQLAIIRTGKCPFRTNGTFIMGGGTPFSPIDISDRGPDDISQKLHDAILSICTR